MLNKGKSQAQPASHKPSHLYANVSNANKGMFGEELGRRTINKKKGIMGLGKALEGVGVGIHCRQKCKGTLS